MFNFFNKRFWLDKYKLLSLFKLSSSLFFIFLIFSSNIYSQTLTTEEYLAMDPEEVKKMMQSGLLGQQQSAPPLLPQIQDFYTQGDYKPSPSPTVPITSDTLFTLDFSKYPTWEQAQARADSIIAKKIKNTKPGESWQINQTELYYNPVELQLYQDQMREYQNGKLRAIIDYNRRVDEINQMNERTHNATIGTGGLQSGSYPNYYYSIEPFEYNRKLPEFPKPKELIVNQSYSK